MDRDGEHAARARLDAWREQGADRLNPLRFRLIDALERRAAGQRGETRRLLDEKLSTLLDAYADDVERAGSTSADTGSAGAPAGPQRGALAELVDYIASHPDAGYSDAAGRAMRRSSSYPELEALEYFREVWSKVRTEKQLRRSLEPVPGNAGPLNSSSLVHRSLSLMRELSPGYLKQFLAYVDALSWIEQIPRGGAATGKEAPRAGSARKGGKGQPR
jgi:hypothetical protein